MIRWLQLGAAGLLLVLAVLALPRAPAGDTETAAAYAARVYYQGEASREWGTLCRLEGGYVSAAHVTANGVPAAGPDAPVTASDEGADWAFLGLDPMTLDWQDFPALTPGMEGVLAGFPATDRDGEIAPGRVYLDDPAPPFVWVELLARADGTHPEGVVGGWSGSCFVVDGKPVAVAHANGFSHIAGTTSTWVLVIPIRDAIRMAQGLEPQSPLSFSGDTRPRPELHRGRHGLNGGR